MTTQPSDDEPPDDDVATDIALTPGDTGDPASIVHARIPADIRARYDVFSYRSAAVVLSEGYPMEFAELLQTLRQFRLTTTMIRTAGGNESEVPKLFSTLLRPLGWHETSIQGDLLVRLSRREVVGQRSNGTPVLETRVRTITRARYLDGHKSDYVKNKIAFDLEWNSKDQTFDRDLYAFNAFAQSGVIDAAVLVTRSASLNPVFERLGPALRKDGEIELRRDGSQRQTREKYGASTTWMGKLLYRLNAGRNGGCPVLVFGITPGCISDWKDDHAT
jgi:hypothetical protein